MEYQQILFYNKILYIYTGYIFYIHLQYLPATLQDRHMNFKKLIWTLFPKES